jgi:hypothetical protein
MPPVEHDDAAPCAEHSLKFRMHDDGQVLHLEPDPPMSLGKYLDSRSHAKYEPCGLLAGVDASVALQGFSSPSFRYPSDCALVREELASRPSPGVAGRI